MTRPRIPPGTAALVREAIIEAAKELGSDGLGKEGLKGFMKRLALTEPASFAGLLNKSLPPLGPALPDPTKPVDSPLARLRDEIALIGRRLIAGGVEPLAPWPTPDPPDGGSVAVVLDGQGNPEVVSADPSEARRVN